MTETAPDRSEPHDVEGAVIQAAMTLAAERGWRSVTLSAIAAAAGLSMADLYARFPTKASILAALGRRADLHVAAAEIRDDDRPRDRLFDAVMRRFDHMAPYREGLRSVLRDLPADPLAALCAGPALARSMRWTLETAGLDTTGIAGIARVKALCLAYLAAVAVWVGDDTPDQARTMARLDRALRRVDGWTRLFGGDAAPAPPPDAAAA